VTGRAIASVDRFAATDNQVHRKQIEKDYE
jgi:hypothetical protein